jgi:DNA-binding transcriptional regulator YdaS (Cro superfamily)
MTTDDAIKFAGGATALALMLRITPSAISQWGLYPPDNRQVQLERMTRKQLKAEPGSFDRLLGFAKAES